MSTAPRSNLGPIAGRAVELGRVCVLAIFLVVWVSAGSARAASPLSWSAPVLVDHPPLGAQVVSCPSEMSCVAVDGTANVVSSTSPAGGARAWTVRDVDGSNALESVSCHSVSLCVAGDSAGNVLTSTDPGGGASAWRVASLGAGNALGDLSCPSASLCVAVAGENVLASTNPTGGASDWTVTPVVRLSSLTGVSCPSVSLCVAIDASDDVVTSTDPTGGASAWTVTQVESPGTCGVCVTPDSLTGVSCPSTSLCVAVDLFGNVLTSTDPTGGASAWSLTPRFGNYFSGVSCPSASLCVAVGAGGVASATDPTGGAGAWTKTQVDGDNQFDGVSCPSVSLCVGVDSDGNVVVGVAPLAMGKPHVSATAVSQPLECEGAPGAKCAATLTLTANETVKGGKVIAVTAAKPARGKAAKVTHKTLILGAVRVTSAEGQSHTAVVALNRIGKQLLAARHVLHANLSVTEYGAVVSSSTVTFRAARTTKKHKR